MQIREDPWLSAVLGRSVFRVDALAAPDPCEALNRHAEGQTAAMYYANVATDRVDLVRQLAAAGFYVVDVNVTFRKQADGQPPSAGPRASASCSVVAARPEHRQQVLGIAERCFRYSRFHLDPALPKELADKIKHDWVLSYFNQQRGDRLWVAQVDGRAIGFLAAMVAREGGVRLSTIDLMGVDEGRQRQGIGGTLVSAFLDWSRSRCEAFQVGTQAANVPSMRFYEACGFTVWSTAYVMHKHVPQASEVVEEPCRSVPSVS